MRRWFGAGILALAATVLGGAPPPPSPDALLASLDRALVHAERQVVALERHADAPHHARISFSRLLERVHRRVWIADHAATIELDHALAEAPALGSARRAAVLGCVEHHLSEASADLTRALARGDDREVAEYRATLRRLRAVRALVMLRARLV
ncbi:MAG TPA: hypothetical protein VLX92_35215 [Kofleriaceae bacterium]|nr:hypothetical protein [Kofleriaceae bacterium]